MILDRKAARDVAKDMIHSVESNVIEEAHIWRTVNAVLNNIDEQLAGPDAPAEMFAVYDGSRQRTVTIATTRGRARQAVRHLMNMEGKPRRNYIIWPTLVWRKGGPLWQREK